MTFLRLIGKLFRRFSMGEKILTFLLLILSIFLLGKLAFSFFREISFERGGIYGEGLVGKPHLLNPLFTDYNDVDRDISTLIFSGIMRYDPHLRNFVPDIAESLERIGNNRTYIVKLKSGITWHDGEPFSADDVIYTYRDILQHPDFKNTLLKEAFAAVEIEKIDAATISFTLPAANSFFVSYLTTGIVPAHLLRGTPIAELEKHTFNRKPIGTGPFQFANNQDAVGKNTNSLTLVRSPTFYGEKPKLKAIRFSFYSSWDQLVRDKKSLQGIPKITSPEIKDKLTDERHFLQNYQLPNSVSVFFQLERPLLEKKRFRQALMKSIQKEELVTLLENRVTIIDTPYLNRFPKEWIHQYDRPTAEAIFKELGLTKAADGFLRDSKDRIPTFVLLTRSLPNSPQDEELAKVANFLKEKWESLGVRIMVKREESENFSILLRKREYDMLLLGQSLGYNNDSFSFWHSTQRGERGLNLSQVRSFRIDSILEDLRRIFVGSKKEKRLQDLEKALTDETPALFLYTPSYWFALDRRVKDFPVAERYAFPSDRFFHIGKVTISGEAGTPTLAK